MAELEFSGNGTGQSQMEERVREAVRQGMVPMLNTGFKQGTRLHVTRHSRVVVMPEPGAVFKVPREVADQLVRMPYGSKLQIVRGPVPQNFTPPPGYKLVPADEQPEPAAPVETVQETVQETVEPETGDVLELIGIEESHVEEEKKTRNSKK